MKILKKINIEKGRVFIVGDLHGQYDALKEKLKQVGFIYNEDTLISVGDLIDRGPKIKEVVDFITETPNCYGVFGNHDNFLLQYDTHPEKWFDDNRNGSEDTVAQLGKNNLKKYKKKLLKNFSLILELTYMNKKIGIIHAGVPMDNDKPHDWNKIITKAKRNKYYRANLMWDRSIIRRIISKESENIPEISNVDFIIHGHTTLDEPVNFKNRFYIDTYAKKKELTFLTFDKNGNLLFI